MKRRYGWWIFAAIVLLFAFDLGFFTAGLLPQTKKPQEVPQVDLIVVLTGGRGRLKEAVSFLLENKGRYLFISGIEDTSNLEQVFAANKIALPPPDILQRIIFESRSTNTHENAQFVRLYIERYEAKSILLVTSNYHMLRAKYLLRRELALDPALNVEIFTYPVESPNFPQGGWWKNPISWKILVSEYLKSFFTRF